MQQGVPQGGALAQQGLLAKLAALLASLKGQGPQPLPQGDPRLQDAMASMPKVGDAPPFLNAKSPIDNVSPVGTSGIPPALLQALMAKAGVR
jgi:hypothetical protein